MSDIRTFPITLPSLPSQRRIARTLSLLDAKIDLLRRQNATLEALGAAVFREWFVEGEWEEEISLDEAGSFLNGLACQKYPPVAGAASLPVLKIKQLRNGIDKSADQCSTEVPDKYIIHPGDLIFSWSASLMVKLWDGPTSVLNQHLFKVSSEDFPQWYMFYWCKYHLARFQAVARAQATTMGHIKRKDLKLAMVNVLDERAMTNCDRIIGPLIERIKNNSASIKHLQSLRDLLLPKLMSGQVRVREE